MLTCSRYNDVTVLFCCAVAGGTLHPDLGAVVGRQEAPRVAAHAAAAQDGAAAAAERDATAERHGRGVGRR